eukprot:13010482-Alexandrium_andersonii.AAC.1
MHVRDFRPRLRAVRSLFSPSCRFSAVAVSVAVAHTISVARLCCAIAGTSVQVIVLYRPNMMQLLQPQLFLQHGRVCSCLVRGSSRQVLGRNHVSGLRAIPLRCVGHSWAEGSQHGCIIHHPPV